MGLGLGPGLGLGLWVRVRGAEEDEDEDEGGDVGHEDHGGRDVLSTVEPRGEAHLVRGGGGVRVRVHGMVHRVVHREACEPEGKSG